MSNLNTGIADAARLRLEKIVSPAHPLTRDDVIWVLELVKKKVTEEDPYLLDLPPSRLLQQFGYFAETAMMLIHSRPGSEHDAGRLKLWLRESSSGLL